MLDDCRPVPRPRSGRGLPRGARASLPAWPISLHLPTLPVGARAVTAASFRLASEADSKLELLSMHTSTGCSGPGS